MKLDKADTIFSLFIRERDGWRCQRCGKIYPKEFGGLECSHYYGRRMESVRFFPANADSACHKCHAIWETNKEEYKEFKIKQLGEEGFNQLTIKANTLVKKDREKSYKESKALYDDLMKQNNSNTFGG